MRMSNMKSLLSCKCDDARSKEHIHISIVQVMNEPREHKGQVGDMVELTVVGRSVLNEILLMGKKRVA